MRRWIERLPGPMPVKYVTAVVIALGCLVALFFVYDWIGSNLLDTGGTIE